MVTQKLFHTKRNLAQTLDLINPICKCWSAPIHKYEHKK